MRAQRLTATIVAALATAVASVVVSVSPAVAASPVTIVSPVSGGTLPEGSTGPLVIDVTQAGDYLISVQCGSNPIYYLWSTGGHQPFAAGRHSLPIKELWNKYKSLVGTSCTVQASGGSPYTTTTTSFTVSAGTPPPPVVPVSPAAGGSLARGATAIVLDFPRAMGATIGIECDGGYRYYNYNQLTGNHVQYPAGRQTIPIASLESSRDLTGDICQLKVDTSLDSPHPGFTTSFTVVGPALALGQLRASQSTFYPLVKDKYRDQTEFKFDINRDVDVTLTIRDREGRAAYRETDPLDEGYGTYTWTWDGTTTKGKPVTPGKYTATISAASEGTTLSSSTTVTVATKTVTRRQRVRRTGVSGTPSTKGNCGVIANRSDKTKTLICRNGVFASVTYGFKLPSDARDVRWGADLYSSDLDVCCKGTITDRGVRTARSRFSVRVQVSGRRAVEVGDVWVSYKARVRL